MFAPKPSSLSRLSCPTSQRLFATAAQAAPAAVQTTPAQYVPRTTPFEVKTSTLKSGASVVTVQSEALSSALALFVKAGPRYETRENVGVSHFAKHMVYQRTQTRSPIFVVRDMESLTAEFCSSCSRESLTFAARLDRNNVSVVQSLLTDSLRPLFHEYIIRDLVPQVEFESQLAEQDVASIFTETLHRTAFRNVGLGRPLHCPSSKAGSITPSQVADYWAERVANPANLTWVAVGVDHEEIKDTLEQSTAKSTQSPSSTYYGGDASVLLDSNTRVGIVFK